jgi:hypothetical protein
MVLAGRTRAEIVDGNKAIFERGELPALEPGAMSYMMSKEAYLTDADDHKPEKRSQVLGRLQQSEILAGMTICPNCVQGKRPNHLHGSSPCRLHLR